MSSLNTSISPPSKFYLRGFSLFNLVSQNYLFSVLYLSNIYLATDIKMGDNEDDGLRSIFSSSSSQSYTTWAVHEARLIEPRETPSKEQAIAFIDELYESKTPFFTKKAIGELAAQLKTQGTAGDTIITKDLTGASLEWKVKVGKSTWRRSYPDPDIRNEWI